MNKNAMSRDDRENKELAEAIRALACAIESAAKELREHFKLATKCDLKEMECRIMSKFSEFAAEQKTFNDQQAEAIDKVNEAIAGPTGLAADIKALNDKITELQNRPDGWTPEDQALLDDLRTKGSALVAKSQAAATAISELDSQNPPTVPPTEPPSPAVNR